MGYTKYHMSELTKVLGTNVFKGKGKQEKDETTSNWSDLPADIMFNILQRTNVIDIVRTVQKVCSNWRQMCKDPCLWRVIYLDKKFYSQHRPNTWLCFRPSSSMALHKICKNTVDRSQGQLVDITIVGFCDDELLQYVAERSSQLRRLEIGSSKHVINHLTKALKKLPLLEELSLDIQIGKEAIQTLGRDCPMLKTLKLSNQSGFIDDDALGFAIARNLPGLRHLQLKRCKLTNTGLWAICNECHHLQVLDLQRCYPMNFKGLRIGSLPNIKRLKFIHHTVKEDRLDYDANVDLTIIMSSNVDY